MIQYANLYLRTRKEFKESLESTCQVVVTTVETPLDEGQMFPQDLLPAGVRALAPIRIYERIECAAENSAPATADVFGEAFVEHEDGWPALLDSFAKADWQGYEAATPVE